MDEIIKPELTVRQTLELARLCHQFKDFSIIGDCYEILEQTLMEQASPPAIKSATSPDNIYFDEYINA